MTTLFKCLVLFTLIPSFANSAWFVLPSGLLFETSDPEPITFASLPIELQHIALCESSGKQSARGPFGEIGIFQIFPKYHLSNAKQMGLDIYDPVDNMTYAIYLYKKNGLRDWASSRSCWFKKLALLK